MGYRIVRSNPAGKTPAWAVMSHGSPFHNKIPNGNPFPIITRRWIEKEVTGLYNLFNEKLMCGLRTYPELLQKSRHG